MDFEHLKHLLAYHTEIIRLLTADVSPEQAQWKPDADTWSIVEIINHLCDEEREDFRPHLDIALHKQEEGWGCISPFAWVKERRYNERDLETSVQNFLAERHASLAWLDTLESPHWEVSMPASWNDNIRAGDIFASWVVHDLWHIQQLTQIRRAYTIAQVAPYSAVYAGRL